MCTIMVVLVGCAIATVTVLNLRQLGTCPHCRKPYSSARSYASGWPIVEDGSCNGYCTY